MTWDEAIGRAVAAEIELAGYSRVAVAASAGIHPQTLGRVIRGGGCNTATLRDIAGALGVQVSTLTVRADQAVRRENKEG